MGTNIRILHACPQTENFDVYFNDCIVCQEVSYFDCTDYYEIDYGDKEIKICKPKKKYYPIIKGYTSIPDNSYHTVVASGKADDLSLFLVPDKYWSGAYSDEANIRFVNLAPDSPPLDFTFIDTSFATAYDIEYKEVTNYYPISPDTYTIRVTIAGTKQRLLTISNVQLRSGRYYTIYILGMVEEYPSANYLLCLDGNS